MLSKKYLVTGGTGFIGRAVTMSMVRNGYTVRVLDNNSRGNIESLKSVIDEIECVDGDIRNPDVVKKAARGMDGVIHLAAVNGTKFFYSIPEVVLDVSTRGIINVIDACLWNGVEEIFLASSSEAYQIPPIVPTPENVPLNIPDIFNPRYSYGGGKIISELYVANFGKKYFNKAIIFRPHNVYGPEMGWEHVIPQFIMRMRELTSLREKAVRFPIQGTGNETRAFIYIDDFVKGLEILLKRGEHLNVYNIGTDSEITINNVAQAVAQFFNIKIKIVPGKIQKGGTSRRLPDITKIKKLGFAPKLSFAQGLQKTANWYNDNAFKKPPALII